MYRLSQYTSHVFNEGVYVAQRLKVVQNFAFYINQILSVTINMDGFFCFLSKKLTYNYKVIVIGLKPDVNCIYDLEPWYCEWCLEQNTWSCLYCQHCLRQQRKGEHLSNLHEVKQIFDISTNTTSGFMTNNKIKLTNQDFEMNGNQDFDDNLSTDGTVVLNNFCNDDDDDDDYDEKTN